MSSNPMNQTKLLAIFRLAPIDYFNFFNWSRSLVRGRFDAGLPPNLLADALEEIVPGDLWPLPTYQEMLFI